MTGKLLLPLAAAALAFTGCSNGPIDAPFTYEIVEFEDLQVPWFGCALDPETGTPTNPNCQPSDPVIFRLDARIRDADTEVPGNNIRVWFNSPYNDIYLLPQEVLEAINLPSGGDWDTVIDRGEIWAEFSGRFEGDYRPTYHEGWTDKNGVASVWVWVNSMPLDQAGTAVQTELHVSTASDVAILRLQAGQ